ncbi:hypothetical protein ANCCAN_20505 [Ancylostoma caninum]|uniref:Uncharacterized protein n=1 Tax=Ancylostoma caninum TaxID=29170 RepID=A0A368FNF5_ANCCA|nr:hypothetical protein ANCCAN_20505 [Ancylostoma caninum]
MKCGGTPLRDEKDELERRNTERGILHCVQVALEIYRRRLKTPDEQCEEIEKEAETQVATDEALEDGDEDHDQE